MQKELLITINEWVLSDGNEDMSEADEEHIGEVPRSEEEANDNNHDDEEEGGGNSDEEDDNEDDNKDEDDNDNEDEDEDSNANTNEDEDDQGSCDCSFKFWGMYQTVHLWLFSTLIHCTLNVQSTALPQ